MSDKEELDLLKQTFEEFIRTSTGLQQAYTDLKEKSQRLSLYLANILENMSDAILVCNNRDELSLWNRRAETYFPALAGAAPPLPLERLRRGAPRGLERLLDVQAGDEEFAWEGPERRLWLEARRARFLDNGGQQLGYIVRVADATELREMQLASQREDRLRVMGEFAAEVAHEIRNPLASIELMASLLTEDLQDRPPAQEILERIRQSVGTMNRTVTNILLYTRNLQPEKQEFAVQELVAQAEHALLDLVVRKRITVTRDVAPRCRVTADFELLKQALVNVMLNAAQAVAEGGRVAVRARRRGGRLQLTVQDNGPGIPRAIRGRVFDPFFTTKNTGTGLGLAMARRVAASHGGDITLRSGPRGTSFVLLVPVE